MIAFDKPSLITLDEYNLIRSLFKEGLIQRKRSSGVIDHYSNDSIEGRVNRRRRHITNDPSHTRISTNTISRLSPTSKHHDYYSKRILNEWGYYNVVSFIAGCRKVNKTEASRIYTQNVLPLSPNNFQNANEMSLAAIRTVVPEGCDAKIYLAMTSVGYNEAFELDPFEHDELWTVLHPTWRYNDVLAGRVTPEDAYKYLLSISNGEYEPIFVNTLVWASVKKI